MTCIAYDGRFIAADRLAINHTYMTRCQKVFREPDGTVMACCGTLEQGLALMDWYRQGKDPAKWPKFQENKDDWTRLVVGLGRGNVVLYAQLPVVVPVMDEFSAWGSARDFAVGAMAMGAGAHRAVEVAMQFDNTCGLGVDCFELA